MLVCGDIVYAQTWQVLYRATFICQYGLFCCMALVSFRLFGKNSGNLQEFMGKWITAPPGKKFPVRLCYNTKSPFTGRSLFIISTQKYVVLCHCHPEEFILNSF